MGRQRGVLGIDIGGTRIRMGFVSEEEKLQMESSGFIGQRDAKELLPYLKRMIGEYIEQIQEGREVMAIAIGVPSTLSKDRRLVISTPNIKGLNNVRLQEILESTFHIPAFVERDVNFLLYYDMRNLKLSPKETTIACYVGTGIGNAVWIGGELLTGRNGVACELGHIPVFGNQLPCVCGNTGCIETIASGKYLTTLCADVFHDEDIKNIFVKHGSSEEIHAFVEAMAIPVATEINIFNPDHIIIGGGVPAMRNFPRREFEESVLKFIRKPLPAQDLELLYSEEGGFCGVCGGGLYALKKVKKRRNT